MATGRLSIPLTLSVVLVFATGRGHGEGLSGDALPMPNSLPAAPPSPFASGEPCPAACPPMCCPSAPHVKVVVPPPEVIFRYANHGDCHDKGGWNLFGHHKAKADSCAVEAVPIAAPVAAA